MIVSAIHDRLAIDIAGHPANHLNESIGGAQKSRVVSIQNRDHRRFGNVQPFPQEADADQDVERAGPQPVEDFGTFGCFDV